MSIRLTATDVGKTHGARKTLRDVTFSLETGQHLVVFGSNGAGKTTLLRILAFIDRPSKGQVKVDVRDGEGAAWQTLEPVQARARMGLVTHNPLLYLDLTAYENLMLFAQLYGVPDAAARVSELLEAVELTHRRNDTVRGFSRGMTQRMAIARALVNDPDILLLDEVYSGLDPRGALQLRQLMEAHARDRIVIEVSHDFESGYESCTDALILVQGRSSGLLPRAGLSRESLRESYQAALEGRLL